MKKLNVFGIVIVALGVVEALLSSVVLPFCKSAGKLVMQCNSSSHVDVLLGLVVVVVGAAFVFAPKVRGVLSYVTALLGLAIALVPNLIVGVCANGHMHCHEVAAPALAVVGVAIALVGFASDVVPEFWNEIKKDAEWV